MIPIHPRIVHFPVALLITVAAIATLALLLKRKRDILKKVILWNLSIGVAMAILAVVTGFIEAKTLVHNDTIHSIMQTHLTLGYIFSGLFISCWIWMIVRTSKMKTHEFAGFVFVLVLAALILTYSAHLGGKMVYEQGAGVIPMKEILLPEENGHLHEKSDSHTHSHEESTQQKEH